MDNRGKPFTESPDVQLEEELGHVLEEEGHRHIALISRGVHGIHGLRHFQTARGEPRRARNAKALR